MPFLQSDALDDQIGIDGTQGFAGGVVSATRPDIIPPNSLADALNIDYDDFGNVVSRFGAVSVTGKNITGTWDTSTEVWNLSAFYWGSSIPAAGVVYSGFFFDTKAAEVAVVAVDNAGTRLLWYGNPSVAFTSISGSTWSSSSDYVYFAQLNDNLFYADGFGSLKYINASNANNAITAGKISRIDVINQHSGYTSIPSVTIAAPPSGTTATAEAVVANDGNVVAVNITNPGSGYTTAPSVSFSPTGAHAVAYVSLSPPSKPIYLTTHTQRLFCASADTANSPDTLYFSDILDGETWDPAGSIRVGGDGDPITGLYSWFGYRLLVFKERSTWVVNADPTQDPADWTVEVISGNVGCVSHRSIAAVGADVLFLARDGVRSLAQIQAGTQTDVGLPLSAPINDVISQIEPTKRASCDGIYYRNRYLLAVPLRSSANTVQATNNYVIAYHALARAWLGKWDNWNVRDFFQTSFSSEGPRLVWSGTLTSTPSAASQIRTFLDYFPSTRLSPPPPDVYRDDGSGFTTSMTTRAYNFGEPMPNKTGMNVQVQTENTLTQPIYLTLEVAKDMAGSFSALDTAEPITAGTARRALAYNLVSQGHWNSIQFRFSSASGSFASQSRTVLHSIAVTGFLDSIKPEQ